LARVSFVGILRGFYIALETTYLVSLADRPQSKYHCVTVIILQTVFQQILSALLAGSLVGKWANQLEGKYTSPRLS
jgi:hypothetical protein